MLDEWQAAIANADMADWITVAVYLLTALLCAKAARKATQSGAEREGKLWLTAAILLVFLGINELLDLQALLTVLARMHARAHGWYEVRRQFQYEFVFFLALASILLGILLIILTWRMHRMIHLALLGFVFIGAFILVRAASFHRFDEFLGRGIPEFPLGSFQEVAGILVVAVAAEVYRRRR